ncbi:hypothetical protein AVEN_176000-1 [Araneus ventricosus]|uniref:Uncharacterized protein n=1 Tax=Araneus ventricosus TaxID=182803 RepID=A0A4Y2ELE3_ARAVE|nr:hypothetical protein AVEN_176000-1 [Araneus ventricosus]
MSCFYGANFMSDGVVGYRYKKFKHTRTDGHDEDGRRRKSVACEDLLKRVDQVVQVRETAMTLTFSRKLKTGQGGQRFFTNEELQDAKETYHNTLAAIFYKEGIGKLLHRFDKCLKFHGGYEDK